MKDVIYQNWLEIITNTQVKFEFPSPKIVGLIIKELRIKSGYSIRQVAGILSINEKTIQRYESGQFYPRLDVLFGIAKLYGYNIDEIVNKIVEKIEKK